MSSPNSPTDDDKAEAYEKAWRSGYVHGLSPLTIELGPRTLRALVAGLLIIDHSPEGARCKADALLAALEQVEKSHE